MIQTPKTDVYFSPAPERVVEEMLKIAQVTSEDVVYDLGCGDGRIVIAAAQKRGARGVGVEMDPRLLAECRMKAEVAGVENLVEFLEQDFFTTDLQPASVLALYLMDSLNVRLRPRILSECRPGTRVVTYSFEMGEWEPDAYTPIAANGVMLWIVPANLSGVWTSSGSGLSEITLQQKFQHLSGTALVEGVVHPIQRGRVTGLDFAFTVEIAGTGRSIEVKGRIGADSLEGAVVEGDAAGEWQAQRVAGTSSPM
jgi:hypothetical protein